LSKNKITSLDFAKLDIGDSSGIQREALKQSIFKAQPQFSNLTHEGVSVKGKPDWACQRRTLELQDALLLADRVTDVEFGTVVFTCVGG